MKILIILALAGLAISKATEKIRFDEQFHPWEFVHDEGWLVWKSAQNKEYTDFGEEKVRYTIWKDNFHRIEEHNRQNSKSYVLGMNHFGDMTTTEFNALMNGYMHSPNLQRTGSTFIPPFNAKPPTAIDWRLIGGVTPVKNQGQCGSCWSFSATGALEGQHWRKTGNLVSLSEQNLIDCSTKFGNHGCHGGIMDYAFNYTKENHGIDTEESYPYEGKELPCRFSRKNVGASDTGMVDICSGNETALQYAVAFVGPCSVAIDASHFSFQFYKEGVYDEVQCSAQNLDHGVLVVGYGEDYHGQQYWLVKNSWSERWGEKGYIKMSRNRDNQCGIASMASYPLAD